MKKTTKTLNINNEAYNFVLTVCHRRVSALMVSIFSAIIILVNYDFNTKPNYFELIITYIVIILFTKFTLLMIRKNLFFDKIIVKDAKILLTSWHTEYELKTRNIIVSKLSIKDSIFIDYNNPNYRIYLPVVRGFLKYDIRSDNEVLSNLFEKEV